MPNWTTNTLTIRGKHSELDYFRKIAQGTPEPEDQMVFDLAQFVPMPKYIKDEPPTPAIDPRWYSWQLRNWGTKWGSRFSKLLEENSAHGSIKYSFETPWCPPSTAIDEISSQFPNLEFELKYDEPGMLMYGLVYLCGLYRIEQSANFSNYVDDIIENEILPEEADRLFAAKVDLLKKCVKRIECAQEEISLREIVFSAEEEESCRTDVYNELARTHGETIKPRGKIGR